MECLCCRQNVSFGQVFDGTGRWIDVNLCQSTSALLGHKVAEHILEGGAPRDYGGDREERQHPEWDVESGRCVVKEQIAGDELRMREQVLQERDVGRNALDAELAERAICRSNGRGKIAA